MPPKKIILDCDPGHDDAIALDPRHAVDVAGDPPRSGSSTPCCARNLAR